MIYLIALPIAGLAFVLFVLGFHAIRAAQHCWARRYPGFLIRKAHRG